MEQDMMMDVPGWLTVLAWGWLAACLLSAAAIVRDVFLHGHRQPTRTLDVVWPASALYLGPIALRLYQLWGRPRSTPTTAAGGLAGAPRQPLRTSSASRSSS